MRGGVRAAQLRVRVFKVDELAEQRIPLGVADRGRIEYEVLVIIAVELLAQLGGASGFFA